MTEFTKIIRRTQRLDGDALRELELIDAAVAYLKANPASPVSQVYFNVTREGTLEVCQCLLREAGGIPAA